MDWPTYLRETHSEKVPDELFNEVLCPIMYVQL